MAFPVSMAILLLFRYPYNMLNMNYSSRELVEANICILFLIHLPCYGTLIRIRNVCFSYKKSGVVSFFPRILNGKKWSYMVFRELSLTKFGVMWFFREFSLKNGYTWLLRENVEKKMEL